MTTRSVPTGAVCSGPGVPAGASPIHGRIGSAIDGRRCRARRPEIERTILGDGTSDFQADELGRAAIGCAADRAARRGDRHQRAIQADSA